MPRVRRGLVIDPLLESYIDSALCSLAEPYGKDRLHPDTLDRMVLDCTTFREMVGEIYEAVAARVHPSDIGCDLWVTRNNRRKVSDEAPGFWAPEYRSLRVSTGWVGVAHRLGPYRLVLGTDDTLHGERIDWDGDVVEETPDAAPPAPRRRQGFMTWDDAVNYAPPTVPQRVGTIRTEATQEIPRDSEAAPPEIWWQVSPTLEAQGEVMEAALQRVREEAQVFIRGDAPGPAAQAPLPSGMPLPHDVAVAMGLTPAEPPFTAAELSAGRATPREFTVTRTCPHCGGSGTREEMRCQFCNGNGVVDSNAYEWYMRTYAPGGNDAETR